MRTLIRNGLIVDGTGKTAFIGDVLIEDDKILDITRTNEDGTLPCDRDLRTNEDAVREKSARTLNSSSDTASAAFPTTALCDPPSSCPSFSGSFDTVIDATGLVVSPGFIDAHAHSDAYLVLEPDAPSKIRQGVTTEINGQCGGSIAPRYGEARLSSDWAALLGDRLTWRSMAEYRDVLSAARPAINTVQFVGHNTLRSSVIGYAARTATPDDMKAMIRLLEQSLDEGGWGLTTGLIYQPGKYSTPEEVVALAKVAAAKGGFYATHMRSEGDRILEAIDEVVDLVKATGIRAEISHLKTSGRRNWGKIDAVLDKIQRAVDAGLLLGSDRYPYCAAGTDLDIVLPDWAQVGGVQAELARLKDEGQRSKIVGEINAAERDWSTVMIGGTWSEKTKPFSGKTIGDILRQPRQIQNRSFQKGGPRLSRPCEEGVGRDKRVPPDESSDTPGSLVCRILEADGCKTGAFFFGMSDENLAKIYARPWIVPGSDASLRAPWGPLGNDHPHPRAYGTMPEFYAKVRALGFSREETVARMTSVPAKRFGIRGRGVLEKGAFADIVVWEEAKFRSAATYEKPHQYAEGIRHVMVNGILSSVGRAGRFLER